MLSANGVQFEASEPKILVINPEFVSMNCFLHRNENIFFGLHSRIRKNSNIFRYKDLWFLVYTLEFEGKSFCAPPNCLCPPPPPSVTLLWHRAWSEDEERWSVEEQIE